MPSTPRQRRRRAGRGVAVVAGHPAQLHLGAVAETGRPDRLAHRQVGVRQVDVLADQRHGDRRAAGGAPARSRSSQVGPVHVAERQAEPAYDVRVETLAVQHLRDVVDARRVRGGDHRLPVDVAVQRQLVLELLRDLPVGAADQRVGLDTDVAQRGHRVLGRLGLQLARRRQVGHQRDVQVEDNGSGHCTKLGVAVGLYWHRCFGFYLVDFLVDLL